MHQRFLPSALVAAASLAITALAVIAVVPGHARGAAEPAAAAAQVMPAVLGPGPQAADGPTSCPYLESKTKATGCPFTATSPEASGCPDAERRDGDSRCPHLSPRAAEGDETSCPYLNRAGEANACPYLGGSGSGTSCPYASPQPREHGTTEPNPPGRHT